MSSYFDYYNENLKTNIRHSNENIKGTCNAMCPQEEVKLRIREHLVHVLEVVESEKKLVKCYSRSAADSNMSIPRFLRPYSVLKKTISYLFFEVTKRKDVPTNILYDFLNDRIRAVRQDMTIQRLSPEHCVDLLEPMIRFYVYYGYLLRNSPMKDYDPVLNKKHSLECVKWYLSCTDIIDRNHGSVTEVIHRISNLEIENQAENKWCCDRVLVESIYILSNLEDIHPLYRYIGLSKELRRNPVLLLSYNLAIAYHNGNYIRVCRLIDDLCPLIYCAVFTYLPIIQRRALQIISHAYNRQAVPVTALTKALKFSTDDETKEVCSHYGLQIHGDAVTFEKNSFKTNVDLHHLQTQRSNEEESNLEDILTYSSNL